ncbi:PREDICTED: uncharacterized protein LOC109192654 [Ipomoea nil]|uniref:uncharacterized protein LOC109192654 n=1 Tax=Ipomoea nil TaxID=35883 RepID=UPI0009017E48|nr:PREDICTED: uncharacterized protein LOC109192654 [Ipomoea nil]
MPMYAAVKDIGPLDREKAIRVKCVRCYEIAENRGSTEIKSQEVLVCDEEGTFIHLNMQNNDVKAIKSKGFPTKMFQLKSYDSLKDPTQVNHKVLFGRVVEIHAPVEKIIGGRPSKLLDFKMADNEGNTLQCTVWDSHVGAMLPYYDAGLKEPLILVFQLCRAKVVNESLAAMMLPNFISMHLTRNLLILGLSKLTAANSHLHSISTATVLSQSTGIDDSTSGALTVTKVVNLLKKKQNGEFYVSAKIVVIEGSFGWMYISCMSLGCNRKLYEQVGDLICTTCDKKYKEGMVKYRVKVIVLDKGLGDVPFLLWDRECSELVVSDIPKELESLVGMRMVVKISLKMEFMKGANSAYTVMRVLRDEALVLAYCSKLIKDQDKDLISKMIDEDEEEHEESDQTKLYFNIHEASNGDNEVNSPLSIQQSQRLDNELEDSNGVRRSLLGQFSSSCKKGKTVAV